MPPKRLKATTNLVSFSPIKHSFISPIAANYFKEFMTKDKAIVCEIQFQPAATDGSILAMLQQRRWETIAVLDGDVNVNAVREFYANLRAANNDGPIKVRNKFIDFSAEAINTHLGLDNLVANEYQTMMDAGPDYDVILREMSHRGSTWIYSAVNPAQPIHLISSCLNRYAQAWCKFIRGNLMPTSQKSELTKERAVLLYCILTGRSINVGQIIHRNILAYRQGSLAGHIHPVLITNLCAAANVSMSSTDEPWIQQMVYSSANISRIANWPYGSSRRNGLGFDEANANAQIPPQPMPMTRLRRDGSSYLTNAQSTIVNARQERIDARTRQRYEAHPSTPHTSSASSSSAVPSHSYTIDDVGQMIEILAIQQRHMEQRLMDLHSRQQAHAQFTAQYINAFNAHHGYSTQSSPPFPTYPEHLLQPYEPLQENEDDDMPGSS